MKITKQLSQRVRRQEGWRRCLWVYLKWSVFKIKEGEKIHGISKVCKGILFPVKALKWVTKKDGFKHD